MPDRPIPAGAAASAPVVELCAVCAHPAQTSVRALLGLSAALVLFTACGGDGGRTLAATSTGGGDASISAEPSHGEADPGQPSSPATDEPTPTPQWPPGADAGPSCDAAQALCDGQCVDLLNDPDHCGTCGHSCPGALGCDGRGRCVAPPGCTLLRRLGHDYFLCEAAMSWRAARDACLALGMDLMVLDDSPEDDFLAEHLKRWAAEKPVWLGLNDLEQGGAWKWISVGNSTGLSGATPTFLNWGGGEPNGDDNPCIRDLLHPFCRPRVDEDCAAMSPSGWWYDVECGTSSAYACETKNAAF